MHVSVCCSATGSLYIMDLPSSLLNDDDGHSLDKLHCQESVISMWASQNQNAASMFLLQLFFGWEAFWSINDGLPVWVKSDVWKLFRFTHFENVAGLTLTLLSGQLWIWTQMWRRRKGVETERKKITVSYNASWFENKDGVHQEAWSLKYCTKKPLFFAHIFYTESASFEF